MTTLTFDDLPTPFVIAEVGGNHEGRIEYARELSKDAVAAGAHAVKFQAYVPDRIVSKLESPDRHAHFGRFALAPEEYVDLARLVTGLGVRFMASVWDRELFELLDPHIEVHKVGSGDLTNRPLVAQLARTHKPLCVATAMSTMAEVADLVAFIDEVNPALRPSRRLCVMHCVATYGEPLDKHANLRAIETLRRELPDDVVIGYSDHTAGTAALEIATCIGAEVLEAHFTDDTTREFRDHHFSKDRRSLSALLEFCSRRDELLGGGVKEPVAAVETAERIREFRRAVYFKEDVPAGTVATEATLTTLRPCVGIEARAYFEVLGRKLRVAKRAFEAVHWEDFEE